jgi:sulfur carrier protein|tara:strand:- start:5816 stop:6019 length:204 start_codon:yes stop_codon:yes gene_type:complete
MNLLTINGELYKSKTSLTTFSLLKYLGFKLDLIVIDYNGTILPREFWATTKLQNQDKIEILTVAGGG